MPKAKKILYLMNVDWDWVKQRPHFIAEGLSINNDVLILYPFLWRRSQVSSNPRSNLNLKLLISLPFGGKYNWISFLNIWIRKFFIYMILKKDSYDLIWISSIEIYQSLPFNHKSKIIYDCMDDVLGFVSNNKDIKKYEYLEKKLIYTSEHIFCSSSSLLNKIIERGANKCKCTLILNAFDKNAFKAENISDVSFIQTNFFTIGYVGTISDWFDFDSILYVLERLKNINFYIIGPIVNLKEKIPKHPRIIYIGPIPHSSINLYINKFNLLIMPFLVNSLVESVDPVKLYEYIYFNKPIISAYYTGLERFSKFVDFYRNKEELVYKINNYINNDIKDYNPSYDKKIFLEENSWNNRMKQIKSVLQIL
jgi:teichuronic acid biosynthesis glycosyltransferase TuaH